MIILEGPDGGGKSTLLEQLREQYPHIPLHERACTSQGGPLPTPELYEWAARDLASWYDAKVHFYDRHPFVSEYIYGPIVRGGFVDRRFHGTTLRRRLAHHALVIVCLPPLETVRASVSDDKDMPGVTTHIDALWHAYASLRATWPASAGLVMYDWTQHQPDRLFPHIQSHCTRWRITAHV